MLAALPDTALSVHALNEYRDACENDSDSELGLFLHLLCPLALHDRFFKLFSFFISALLICRRFEALRSLAGSKEAEQKPSL